VFLSGNGPLVKIIREALTRDRQRSGVNRGEAIRAISAFIDNVHRFLATYSAHGTSPAPYENAVIFDEAQRAWDSNAVWKKRGIQRSEPELLLDIMERAPNWCVVVALVGGGQEIYHGEAGIAEWGRALNSRECAWRVIASPEALDGGESVAGQRLFSGEPSTRLEIVHAPELHLEVSVQSPRARLLGEWVNSLVTGEIVQGTFRACVGPEFPVVLKDAVEASLSTRRERGPQRALRTRRTR